MKTPRDAHRMYVAGEIPADLLALYLHIYWDADPGTGAVWFSTSIAKDWGDGATRQKLHRQVKKLAELGFIKLDEVRTKGRRRSVKILVEKTVRTNRGRIADEFDTPQLRETTDKNTTLKTPSRTDRGRIADGLSEKPSLYARACARTENSENSEGFVGSNVFRSSHRSSGETVHQGIPRARARGGQLQENTRAALERGAMEETQLLQTAQEEEILVAQQRLEAKRKKVHVETMARLGGSPAFGEVVQNLLSFAKDLDDAPRPIPPQPRPPPKPPPRPPKEPARYDEKSFRSLVKKYLRAIPDQQEQSRLDTIRINNPGIRIGPLWVKAGTARKPLAYFLACFDNHGRIKERTEKQVEEYLSQHPIVIRFRREYPVLFEASAKTIVETYERLEEPGIYTLQRKLLRKHEESKNAN